MSISRRALMKNAGMAAMGTGFAGLTFAIAKKAIGAAEPQTSKIPDLPWPYKKLDPIAAAEEAYRGYYQGRCG